jgi:uncharacterized delta-60 repeat protein
MKKALLLPLLFLLLLVQAQDGTLDPTFGTSGFVRLAEPFIGTAFTPDGKLVGLASLVESTGTRYLIFRYNTDGTLDASFGSGGVIQILPTAGSGLMISVQNYGDVLVLSQVFNFIGSHLVGYTFVLTLYKPNGSNRIVQSFSVGREPTDGGPLWLFSYADKSWSAYRKFDVGVGFYTVIYGVLGAPNLPLSRSPGTTSSQSNSMAVAGDGKIYVGGTETGYFDKASSQTTRLVVQRFMSNGVPDFTYGTNSVVASNLSPGISNLVVQNDGKLLGSLTDANGSPLNKFIRFNVDGSVDATFGSNGVVTTPFTVNKILVQSNGKIIVGGTLNGDFALARYNADGTQDQTFRNGGVTTTDFGGTESLSDMTISGNRLYAYGGGILAAYRLNTTPCIPPTFLNDLTMVRNANCGKSDGAIWLVPTSGTAPFLYSIDGGKTYVSGPNNLRAFEGLAAGVYQLRIVDANGCESAIVQKEVSAVDCPPVPTVRSFSPASGPVGTKVTITGNNFSPVAENNTVYFGAVKAAVLSATSTQLNVAAPAGTTYQPITVTTNGLTGYSTTPFVVTCPSGVGYSFSLNEKTDLPISGFMTISDIDGDGKPDLIGEANRIISISRNTGSTGAVSFAPNVNFAATSTDHDFATSALGDVDGDGKPDLVIPNGLSKTISILKNTSTPGNISFAPAVELSTGSSPISVTIGDVDGDGKPDIAASSYAGNSSFTVSILKNTSTPGNISFAPGVEFPAGINLLNLAFSDLDGDGKPDLAVRSRFYGLQIFQNTSSSGAISFALKLELSAYLLDGSFVIGDLDGDERPDVAILSEETGRGLYIFQNTSTSGAISFASGVSYRAAPDYTRQPYDIAIGDVNGDGKPDLAVTNEGFNDIYSEFMASGRWTPPLYRTVDLFINNSTSGTVSFSTVSVSKSSFSFFESAHITIGDMNGDGKSDLVTTSEPANTTSIIRNLATCPATLCTPPTLLNDLTIVRNATCGKSDGAIWIVPTSGTAPFLYSINGGQTYVSGPDNLLGFENLSSGTYQLRIKDAKGCESEVVQRVVSSGCPVTCTPPTLLNNLTIIGHATCGMNDGALYLVPTTGTAPFQYSINGGATYVGGPDNLYAFTGLAAGTYQLRIKDATGCESAVVQKEVLPLYGNCATTSISGKASQLLGETNSTMLVYPNPSSGMFRLQLQHTTGKVQVTVLNSKGQVVQQRRVNISESNAVDFNLTGKAKGLYLIKVMSEKGVQTTKVMVQ